KRPGSLLELPLAVGTCVPKLGRPLVGGAEESEDVRLPDPSIDEALETVLSPDPLEGALGAGLVVEARPRRAMLRLAALKARLDRAVEAIEKRALAVEAKLRSDRGKLGAIDARRHARKLGPLLARRRGLSPARLGLSAGGR